MKCLARESEDALETAKVKLRDRTDIADLPEVYIVRPANRDWACQTERCHTLSNKISLQ